VLQLKNNLQGAEPPAKPAILKQPSDANAASRAKNDARRMLRYRPMSPAERLGASGGSWFTTASLTAPVLASWPLFPIRFAAAVDRLLERPDDKGLPPQHAFWYFGSALRLWIEPTSLRWRLSDYVDDGRGVRWIGSSFLDAARWGEALESLDASPVHKEMTDLVRADFRFREIRAYRRLCRGAERGHPRLRSGVLLTTREHVDDYFRYCVELARSVREQGVLPRHKTAGAGAPSFGRRAGWLNLLERGERDIGVAIARSGELVRHLGGKHRTALAQALSVTHIPVEVRMVHVRWLARQMKKTGLPAHKAMRAGLATLQETLGDGRL
jgi:hypothetical protein